MAGVSVRETGELERSEPPQEFWCEVRRLSRWFGARRLREAWQRTWSAENGILLLSHLQELFDIASAQSHDHPSKSVRSTENYLNDDDSAPSLTDDPSRASLDRFESAEGGKRLYEEVDDSNDEHVEVTEYFITAWNKVSEFN